MTINKMNNPSFGRVYEAAATKASREILSKYIDIVKSQKNTLRKIDANDYDVFVFARNESLDTLHDVNSAFRVEVRKKLMPPFKDNSTEFLVLNDGKNAVKTFRVSSGIEERIAKFLSKIGDSLS